MEMANPYQTPTGDLATAADEIGVIKFFSPNCRIGRMRYLSHSMLITLASYVVIFPMVFLMGAAPDMAVLFGGIMALAYVGVVAVLFIMMIQRLHDLNRSGWLSLLTLVPLANIFIAIYLLFWPGTEGSNNYGGTPPPNSWWNWALGLAMPVLVGLGIVAAMALPSFTAI